MRGKKMAFISSCPSEWWAGCEDLWALTALELLERGVGVSCNVHSYKTMPALLQKIQKAGGNLHFWHSTGFYLPNRLYQLFAKRAFRHWLKKTKPDLIIVSEGDCFEARHFLSVCHTSGIPYVTITHASTPWAWPSGSDALRFREFYKDAQKCFFVCRENLNSFQLKIAASLPHAEIVRNPFKVPYGTTLPWPSEENPVRWACIATADLARKGQDLLFSVMQDPKWKNRNLQIDLYCHGGPHQALFYENIKQFDLQNVHLRTEEQTDISALWKSYSMLVLPSRREGLPLVVVEAMLSGRPCIVTDVGGNSEIVEDNKTGFIAKAPTVQALDEAMERAWLRKADWESMGSLAATQIREVIPAKPAAVFADLLLKLI